MAPVAPLALSVAVAVLPPRAAGGDLPAEAPGEVGMVGMKKLRVRVRTVRARNENSGQWGSAELVVLELVERRRGLKLDGGGNGWSAGRW